MVGPEAEGKGGYVSPGISYFGSGLQEGECGLKIHSLNEKQLGTWRCTLLETRGSFHVISGRGEVDVLLEGQDTPKLSQSEKNLLTHNWRWLAEKYSFHSI